MLGDQSATLTAVSLSNRPLMVSASNNRLRMRGLSAALLGIVVASLATVSCAPDAELFTERLFQEAHRRRERARAPAPTATSTAVLSTATMRSEERRVGKECRL